MSEEILLRATGEDAQQKEERDRPLYLTGTCANCKSRLRFNAREICNWEIIHCPHCGFDFGEDGKEKLIDQARKLLGKSKT